VGRHSGAICRACQELILLRDGRLVEHQQVFPTLGTSLSCVGSYSRALDDAGPQGPLHGRADAELHPFVSRPQPTTPR
jgi:hypothetical protein